MIKLIYLFCDGQQAEETVFVTATLSRYQIDKEMNIFMNHEQVKERIKCLKKYFGKKKKEMDISCSKSGDLKRDKYFNEILSNINIFYIGQT